MDVLEASRVEVIILGSQMVLIVAVVFVPCSLFFAPKISTHSQRVGTYDLQLTTKT